MIIVSQDKNIIYNYDKIEYIFAVPDFEDFGKKIKWEIKAHLDSDKCYRLGVYKAEERAKEILQEIIEQYEYCQVLQEGHGLSLSSGNNYVYAMPKE